MQTAAQVTELEVPLRSRVAWLRKNYSYFEDEHKDKLMGKLEALTKTSGKKVKRIQLSTPSQVCIIQVLMRHMYNNSSC